MPAFLLPLLSGFLKCKTCLWVAAIGALALAGWLYLKHAEHAAAAGARAAAIAEMQKATAAEHDRRMQVERYMQQWATGSIARVDALNSKIAALRATAARASAAHDKEACWPPDATARIRGMAR